MGKKAYQSGDRYARQGSQPKKKRPRKPSSTMNASDATSEAESPVDAPRPAPRPVHQTMRRPDSTTVASSYSYVVADLKRTGIFAAAAFVILIILAVIL